MDSRKRKALMDILYHIARARGFTISSYCEAGLNSSTRASLSRNPGNHAFHIREAYHRPVTSASLDKTSTNQLAKNKHKSVGFTAGNAGQTRHLVTLLNE